jgi:bacteriocin-like protein
MGDLRELTAQELDQISGGKITEQQINGGGNTPNGNANGVPTTNVNPTGKAPPGQNS